MERKGIVMVYTGDGKGKTTAAMGLVLRAAGHGHRAAVVQFMKGQHSGEVDAIDKFLPTASIYRFGGEGFVNPDNPDPEDEHQAQLAQEKAIELLRSDLDLVVLDEANVAMDYGLISAASLMEAVGKRASHMTVVITGRGLRKETEQLADLISEVKEVRHHWRKGIPAQDGIEQ